MLHSKKILVLTLAGAAGMSLMGCPGPGNGSDPKATNSGISNSAQWVNGNEVKTKLDGKDVTISKAGGVPIGTGNAFYTASVSGLSDKNNGAGMFNSNNPNSYIAYATSSDGDSVSSTASYNLSGGIGPYTPNNTQYNTSASGTTTLTGVNYGYSVGQVGRAPITNGGTNGTITINGNQFDAYLGGVTLDGQVRGFNVSGISSLAGGSNATGTFEGTVGTTGSNGSLTTSTGGVFVGNNSTGADNTAYAGGFLK